MKTALIGGDWGTSNLRVFRYAEGGLIAATRTAPTGIMAVGKGGFEAALAALVSDWLAEGPAPILLAGMVGSRQGWLETPYARCPAGLDDIAGKAQRLTCGLGAVHILPGLCIDEPGGRCDVMRGEEVQILGAWNAAREHDVIITPGTHSKWASVEDAAVTDFETHLTGETYAVLKAHSILGRLMDGEAHDAEAFALGVGRAEADPALLRLLFSVRAEGLFGRIAPTALAAYLSGLLIGSEVAAGLAGSGAVSATLIGEPALTALYAETLAICGVDDVISISGETAAGAGLWRLAGAMGLVE
jgi:2-dehydro-3-deoxygalactonokinase